MAERKVSRRRFLNYGITAVVAGVVAGVGSYYAGLLSVPPERVITTTVTAPGVTVTAPPTTTTVTAPPVTVTPPAVTVAPPPTTTTVTAPPVTTTTTVTTTPPPKTPAPKEIVYGIGESLTGAYAVFAAESKALAEMHVNRINSEGGIYVREYDARIPLRIIWYDDKSSTTEAISCIERAVLVDKVDFYLPASGHLVFSVVPMGIKHNVFMVGGSYGASLGERELVEKAGYKYIFSTFKKNDVDALTVLRWAKDDGRPKTIFYLQEDSEEARTYCEEGGKKNAENYGLKVVGHEKYIIGTKDYTDIILKAKAADPDILDAMQVPTDAITVVMQMRELGYSPKIFGGTKNVDLYMVSEPLYPHFEGFHNSGMGWNDDLGPKGFDQEDALAFERKEGYLPCQVTMLRLLPFWVLKQAIEYAGTFEDKDKLAQILHTREFKVALLPYPITINPKNGTATIEEMFGQYQNHMRRTIHPPKYATAKVWYPMPTWKEKFPAVGEYKPPPVVPV